VIGRLEDPVSNKMVIEEAPSYEMSHDSLQKSAADYLLSLIQVHSTEEAVCIQSAQLIKGLAIRTPPFLIKRRPQF
jgi:hypothetical protein